MEICPSVFLNSVSEVVIVNLPKTCGLTNLGNTCFFNSVMQCLGQTPYLLELLEETSSPGQYFSLPGGKFVIGEKGEIDLDPLDGTHILLFVLFELYVSHYRQLGRVVRFNTKFGGNIASASERTDASTHTQITVIEAYSSSASVRWWRSTRLARITPTFVGSC